MMPLPFCVYILFSHKDLPLYIGFTANLAARLKSHNDGKAKSTAPRRPLDLIFCEFYLFEADARKREMYFKTTMGKKAIKLMLRDTLLKLVYNAKIEVTTEDELSGLRGATESIQAVNKYDRNAFLEPSYKRSSNFLE